MAHSAHTRVFCVCVCVCPHGSWYPLCSCSPYRMILCVHVVLVGYGTLYAFGPRGLRFQAVQCDNAMCWGHISIQPHRAVQSGRTCQRNAHQAHSVLGSHWVNEMVECGGGLWRFRLPSEYASGMLRWKVLTLFGAVPPLGFRHSGNGEGGGGRAMLHRPLFLGLCRCCCPTEVHCNQISVLISVSAREPSHESSFKLMGG